MKWYGGSQKIFTTTHPITPGDRHYDLLSAAHHALLTSPISWTYHHVKGHQDDDPDATLDQWALLNIQMDSLAKAYWLETLHQPNSCNMVFFENET